MPCIWLGWLKIRKKRNVNVVSVLNVISLYVTLYTMPLTCLVTTTQPQHKVCLLKPVLSDWKNLPWVFPPGVPSLESSLNHTHSQHHTAPPLTGESNSIWLSAKEPPIGNECQLSHLFSLYNLMNKPGV